MIFHIRFKNVQKEPGHTSVQAPFLKNSPLFGLIDRDCPLVQNLPKVLVVF